MGRMARFDAVVPGRVPRRVLIGIGIAVAYYVSARLGLLLQLPGTNASAIWAPSGIGFAALLLYGTGYWPAVTVAAFVANLLTLPSGPVWLVSSAIAAGNTLELVVAVTLVRRVSGAQNPFERGKDTVWFVVVAALSSLLAATNGAVVLRAAGIISPALQYSAWVTWWIGDVAGIVILAPALYAWATNPRVAFARPRAFEAAAVVAITIVLAESSLGGWIVVPVLASQPNLLTLVLLWTAFRFSARETATLAVLIAGLAIVHAGAAMSVHPTSPTALSAVINPFVRDATTPNAGLLSLQMFVGTIAVRAVVLAALIAERDQVGHALHESEQRSLRDVNQSLELRITERTYELQATNLRLRDEVRERQRAEVELRASLLEKDTLLREIHHRVKNNLAVVSSLLYLESTQSHDGTASRALDEAQHRIRSMAMVHEALYQSGNLAAIDFRSYLEQLLRYLRDSYAIRAEVHVQVCVDHLLLDADRAIPCGLIVTELFTNSLKHAFPGGRSGTIAVRLRTTANGHLELGVHDNGVGVAGDAMQHAPATLGWRLVRSLSRQLDATFSVEATSPGLDAVVRFPMERLSA